MTFGTKAELGEFSSMFSIAGLARLTDLDPSSSLVLLIKLGRIILVQYKLVEKNNWSNGFANWSKWLG